MKQARMRGWPWRPIGRRAFVTMDAAIVITAAVFAVDFLTNLRGAIAVLYIAVPLLLATVYSERVVLASGVICGVLTTIAFLSQHMGEEVDSAYTRFGMSLAAIAVTTLLTLRQIQIAAEREKSERGYRAIFHAASFAAWESDWSRVRELLLEEMGDERDAEGWLRAHPEMVGKAARRAVILQVNQAAVQLFQAQNADELLSKSVVGRYPVDAYPAFASMVAKLIRGDDVVEAELPLRTVKGRRIDVILRITFAQREDPWSRALVMAFDETERKEARAKLEQASADLAHAARVSMVGQLTAAIAHEVNQPLTAIVAYGKSGKRWLDRDQPDLAEAEQCLDKIVANGTRAADVIARIRSLIRKGPTNAEAVDLLALITETVALVFDEARAAGVKIECAGWEDVPSVWVDRVQIQQVLANLLLNGIQATQSVQNRERLLTIKLSNADIGLVRVDVCDNGTGIENPSQLFTPFLSTKADGMGMGLSISRSIVEALGGSIGGRNNPDFGATISFSLPTRTMAAEGELQTSV